MNHTPFSRSRIVRAVVRECGRDAALYAGQKLGMKAPSVRSLVSKETARMRRVGWVPADPEYGARSAVARAAWNRRSR